MLLIHAVRATLTLSTTLICAYLWTCMHHVVILACVRARLSSAVSCRRIGRTLLATGGFNGTILSNGTFAAGWEVKYNGSINIQHLTQGGINQNQALCAELPSPGVSTVLDLPSTLANVPMRPHPCSVDIAAWQMCA